MNKKCFLLTILFLTSSAAHLLGRPITAISQDGMQFEVEEGVLKTSGILKNIIDDCSDSPEEVHLCKSAEEFQLILPLLESIHESKNDIEQQLSEKESFDIAQIVELANFFDVPQVIDHGGNALKDQLDALCGQHQEGSGTAIQSFLESIKPLSPEMNQAAASKIITNHPAKKWLLERSISSKTLAGHRVRIDSVSYSPDGNYLATGSDYNTAKIWNVETDQCIHTLTGHRDMITSVSFSPDGNYLTTGSHDNTAKIWNVGCLSELEQFLSRDITLEQAAMLILFYENRDNETFTCPEYLAEDLESLSRSIKECLGLKKEQRFIANPEGSKRRKINN